MTEISSISINGRMTLNMHSLNNEGGEGNQILTRQVTIINNDGRPATVTAVSGDMLKHIQVEHLYRIAKDEGLDLCQGCQKFNANRITADGEFTNSFSSGTPDSEVLSMLLERCCIDDMAGILVTTHNKNTPRKSVAEFGWLVALPEANESENFFHVKYVSDPASAETDAANLGQNIFHRPANSGIYALVGNFDVCRIGYNDIDKSYTIDDATRHDRYGALLKSLLYTFIKPTGAMRNTQHPHVVNFEGVITYSVATIPAPTVSALNPDYHTEISTISENLNKIQENAITSLSFNSMAEFTDQMAEIIQNSEPYTLK